MCFKIARYKEEEFLRLQNELERKDQIIDRLLAFTEEYDLDLRLILMNSVQAKLEASRQELLDLSLRNKLINYWPLKTRGVEIVDELPEHVYQILVQADRAMYFLPKPEPETENDKDIAEQLDWFALPEDDEERDFARHTDNRLQTGYSLAELQRRLLNTYYTARTYIEEQGVTDGMRLLDENTQQRAGTKEALDLRFFAI